MQQLDKDEWFSFGIKFSDIAKKKAENDEIASLNVDISIWLQETNLNASIISCDVIYSAFLEELITCLVKTSTVDSI